MTHIGSLIWGALICASSVAAGAAGAPAGPCAKSEVPVKISPLMDELLREAEKTPFASDICDSWRRRILGAGALPGPPHGPGAATTVWTATFAPGVLQCDSWATCIVPAAMQGVSIRVVRSEPQVNGAEILLRPNEVRRLLRDDRVRYLVPSCTLAQPKEPEPRFDLAFRSPHPARFEQGCERGDSLSWGLADACIPSPLHLPPDRDGKTVAVLDSGLDCMHDDIESRIVGAGAIPNGRRCPLKAGTNFAYQSYMYEGMPHKDVPADNCDGSDPPRCQGHGTGVAGVVASVHSRLPGVDPRAHLVSMRILTNDWDLEFANWKGLESAILEAAKSAQILNISANWSEDHPNVAAAIDEVTADGALLVVVSAKKGEIKGSTDYPAVYSKCNPAVIAVADIMNDWQQAGVYYWGMEADTDAAYMVAPGNEILTSYSNGTSETAHEFQYGASFAAPHVSGAASLVWSMDEFEGCSAPGIREVLSCSARPTDISGTPEPRKRLHLGCLFGQKGSQICSEARKCIERAKLSYCK